MSSGKVVLGVLAGIAIGATLGILFAPDKGSETRRKISEKGEDFAEDLEAKLNDLLDSFKQKFEEAKKEFSEEAEQQVEDMKNKMSGPNQPGTGPSTS